MLHALDSSCALVIHPFNQLQPNLTVYLWIKPDDFYPRLLAAMISQKIYPAIGPEATFDMTPINYVAHGISQLVLMKTAVELSNARAYHTVAHKTHEVSFSTLIEGINTSGMYDELREIDFEEFKSIVAGLPRFAPLLHELRAGGRCSTRRMDTTHFDADLVGCNPPLPSSEVTPSTIANCILFMQKQHTLGRDTSKI